MKRGQLAALVERLVHCYLQQEISSPTSDVGSASTWWRMPWSDQIQEQKNSSGSTPSPFSPRIQ
jgi:hypothetical protein